MSCLTYGQWCLTLFLQRLAESLSPNPEPVSLLSFSLSQNNEMSFTTLLARGLMKWWSGKPAAAPVSHTLDSGPAILSLDGGGGNRTVSLRKVQCICQGLGPVWFSDIPTWKVSCRGGMCLLCHYFVCLMRHNVKGTVSPRLKCSYSCAPPQDNVRKK